MKNIKNQRDNYRNKFFYRGLQGNFKTLDSIKGDFRLVKNRQFIRDFLWRSVLHNWKISDSYKNLDQLKVLFDIKDNLEAWLITWGGSRK